jgi:dipeptidyl aminopeptidase/acylaminoacyl peptidase
LISHLRTLSLGLAISLTSTATAQTRRPMTIHDQFRFVEPGSPIISPDGKWVFYTIAQRSLAENKKHSSIWLTSTEPNSKPRQLLQEGDSSPVWAPDSRSVFFLRSVGEGDDRSREFFQQEITGEKPIQRSHIGPGPDSDWRLSSDGKFFLLIRPEPKPEAPGAASDVIFFNEGSNGQTRDVWTNLWRYDIDTATMKRITQRQWVIDDADISPDGRLAVVATRTNHERNSRWRSELFLVDLASGAATQVTKNVVPEDSPRWSPDGKHVLFTAVRLDRWENGNGDLWLLDVDTRKVQNLTPKHTGWIRDPVFSPDGKYIFAASGYGTTRFPIRIDIGEQTVSPLVKTAGNVRTGSWSSDRQRLAYIYQDFNTPPDIYIGAVASTADRQQRITDLNSWVKTEIQQGTVQRVSWPSFDGKKIEGLLYLPPAASSAPKPMIVHVACGPGCFWLNSFSVKHQIYAGLGYAQLLPNVRGAANYDDVHLRANMFDIEGGDRKDILTGVTAMVARGIADPSQLGIDGWSYGGVLAGFTITTTNRFKAASLGATVSDWTTDYGAIAFYSSELWYIGGNPWTQPEKWRAKSSLTRANLVRTPTLLHHGVEDDSCSPFQSWNYYVALRRAGTTARLILYPGEGHDFQQPQHLRQRDLQDIAWMEWFIRGRRVPEADGFPPQLTTIQLPGEKRIR